MTAATVPYLGGLSGPPYAFTSKAPSSAVYEKGIDSDCVLCLHCDGADGGTTFVDSSDSGHTVTAFGAAITSDDQIRFGRSSLKGDGSYAHVRISDTLSDFDFGADDFTIDFWAFTDSHRSKPRFLSFWQRLGAEDDEDLDHRLEVGFDSLQGSYPRYRAHYTIGSTVVFDLITPPLDAQDRWTHFALVRSGTSVLLFVDGKQYAADTLAATQAINLSTYRLEVGRAGLWGLAGYLDEVRISTVARWTSTFVPQEWPYNAGWNREGRGFFDVRALRYRQGRGEFATIRPRRYRGGRGSFDLLSMFARQGRGEFISLSARNRQGRGAYHAITVPRFRGGRGTYVVMTQRRREARGRSGLALPRYRQGRGEFDLWSFHRREGRGGFDVHGPYYRQGRGSFNLKDSGAQYELYHGVGSEPDLSAAPAATSATLPITYGPLAYPQTHYFVLRLRSNYGMRSHGRYSDDAANKIAYKIELDAAGEEVVTLPTSPDPVSWSQLGTDSGRLIAWYDYAADDAADRATHWRIWRTSDGVDPVRTDPATDEIELTFAESLERLEWDDPGSYGDGTVLKLDVAASRWDDPDWHNSAKVQVYQFTIDDSASANPTGESRLGVLRE